MADISQHGNGISIAQALRGLPLEAPTQSLWPVLATHTPKKTARRFLPLALAAGMALLTLIPLSLNSPLSPDNHADANLQALMQQSSQLENILLATRNATASNASAEVISLALEDRIHAIDTQLGNNALSAAQQLSLWQQRISLLQAASGLYSSQRYQQAEGRPYEIALVESF